MWLKPHSHKELVRLFQMPACMCYTWDCLPALSLFFIGFGSDWTIHFFYSRRWFLRKP